MSKVSISGDRLGSGNRMDVGMKNYERSSHDLSYIWRSSMSAGTLVPFMREVVLPGDSFKINLDCDVKTLPTVGPLFGSYKVQLDVFLVPLRLYVPKLQLNMLDIGNNMSLAKLPQVRLKADYLYESMNLVDLDNLQINSSCIFSYLGIRGLGTNVEASQILFRDFNASTWLSYWEIYKNYYANKQEEEGAVIHNPLVQNNAVINTVILGGNFTPITLTNNFNGGTPVDVPWNAGTFLEINFSTYEFFNPATVVVWIDGVPMNALGQIFGDWQYNENGLTGRFYNQILIPQGTVRNVAVGSYFINAVTWSVLNSQPRISRFPLNNIDDMRLLLMQAVQDNTNYVIENTTNAIEPYSLALKKQPLQAGLSLYSIQSSQEGLALKTYQSDLFNNWISTEWIDGDNGVNAITAIDTTSGSITVDEINLQSKIYNMLNRIALSGGSYDDWLNAVYTHERINAPNNPMYIGGLSKELAFQEVVSTAEATSEQPLGTLAGRGVLTNKHKGGHITVNINEPSYIMGIVSITPRIDYSQGNKWDVNLKTLDDLHKPALDEIGFQDLITDQMAWWDTKIDPAQGNVIFKSAGKQPAWINYMTNVNEIRGTFAEQSAHMFMVLNRRYEAEWTEDFQNIQIKDLTTYIDPSKYNNIFADTRLDSQNFWSQIKVDIFARRKMSARVIPNL